MSDEKPKLLIIGGGFAGVTLATKCEPFMNVTTVDKKIYGELTWAVPRGIMDAKVAERMTFLYMNVPNMGLIIQGTVAKLVGKEAQLANGDIIKFDYVAVCSGSDYSGAAKSDGAATATPEERLQELTALRARIAAAKDIIVVGGGPAGVEMAAEIVDYVAGKSVTLVHGGKQLLPSKPPKMAAMVQRWLEAHGVKVKLGVHVVPPEQGAPAPQGRSTIVTKAGERLEADMVLWCTGGKPNTAFMREQLATCLDERGAVKVQNTLQIIGQPHMFALGDCNDLPDQKLGYLAVEQAKLAAASLQAMVKAAATGSKSPKLGVWKPQPEMMIVTLGRSDGACQCAGFVCGGYMPTSIKSKGLFIDEYRRQWGLKG